MSPPGPGFLSTRNQPLTISLSVTSESKSSSRASLKLRTTFLTSRLARRRLVTWVSPMREHLFSYRFLEKSATRGKGRRCFGTRTLTRSTSVRRARAVTLLDTLTRALGSQVVSIERNSEPPMRAGRQHAPIHLRTTSLRR